MAASIDESLYPWERFFERRYRVDFLFRTETRTIIDGYPIGSDYSGWPHVYRVVFAIRDEHGLTSFFGRAYRKRMRIMPSGGGIDLPVWRFDVNGVALARHGFDPPITSYVPLRMTDMGNGLFRVDEWRAENVIDQ